ncbi:MAG: Crp/Fnr family transcriptional regulator [Bacteroidales bacterium]|nr:Crp/Fnr family transcriptional regulator [Bacteroidales bacterium]
MTTTSIDIARKIAEINHPLNRESLHALADILVCKKYRKGETVLQAGEVCRSMMFIEKGMLRQFYFKYDKDLTEHIGYENGLIICIESYFKQEPTRLMVETLEPTVVWEIPRMKMLELADKYSDISHLYCCFLKNSLIESQIKADVLRFEPAHERYNKLIQLHPEILKRAPLVYIASLLQMTPETLSRVRSSMFQS